MHLLDVLIAQTFRMSKSGLTCRLATREVDGQIGSIDILRQGQGLCHDPPWLSEVGTVSRSMNFEKHGSSVGVNNGMESCNG